MKANVSHLLLQDNVSLDDDFMQALGKYINSNASIQEINLERTQISDKGIEILELYLQGNVSLKRLDLSGNQGITHESVPFLTKMIESSHIEDIVITKTSIIAKNSLVVPLAHNRIKYGLEKLEMMNLYVHF